MTAGRSELARPFDVLLADPLEAIALAVSKNLI